MNKTKTITGVVVYKNIGMGFWGIEELNGKKWLPINLPKSLEQEGKRVIVKIKELEDVMTMHMWGTPVKIVG